MGDRNRPDVMEEDPRQYYEIYEELGKGSCGVVYKARSLRTLEVVAIKILPISESVRKATFVDSRDRCLILGCSRRTHAAVLGVIAKKRQ
jgi:serine/threonine protein kinase